MTKEEIFNLLKQNFATVLPKIDHASIQPHVSMKDLGANSIDRMEIILQTMSDVGVKVPMVEFGGLKNIQGIVDLLHQKHHGA